jgi:hypothetical protein
MTTATELPCYTFEARSLRDGTTSFVSVAAYMHPADGKLDHMHGVGPTRRAARGDCAALLEDVGVTAPTLDECDNPQDQRVLLGVALKHCRVRGFAIEPVDPPYAALARGNGDGVPR